MMQACNGITIFLLFGSFQLLSDAVKFGIAAHDIFNRCDLLSGCLLCYMGDTGSCCDTEVATIFFQLPANQCKEGRFTRAVGTGDTDLVTLMDGEADIAKEQALATAEKELWSK
jgi:hypothetical protein